MPVYSLVSDGPQLDPARDVVGVRARVFSDSSYVNFISIVSPAADVARVLPTISDSNLHSALAHAALPHIQAALASKRLPLADPTMVFEVRVPASQIEAGLATADTWDGPLTFDWSPSPAAPPTLVVPRRLQVRNLLSFDGDGVALDLGGLTVLVGPNGAGKTNLLRSMRMLRDLLTRSLHTSQRHRPLDGKPLGFDLDFDADGQPGRYEVDFELTDAGPLILRERLSHHDQLLLQRTSSRDVVYRSTVRGDVGQASVDVAHQMSSDTTGLALLGREAIAPVIAGLRRVIDETSHQQMFDRRDAGNGAGGGEFFLNGDGSNVTGVILRMLQHGPTADALSAAFAEAVGSGADLQLRGNSWRAVVNDEDFAYSELSHGTQLWLQLMAMVIDPYRPGLLLIDEPENGLHPDLLFRFANHALAAVDKGPIVLATHSTNLLDHLHLIGMARSLRVVENLDGATSVRSIESELELDDVNELLVGSAWAAGLLGGNPQ